MKRQFLEDLGLDKALIDQIMAENGKDIEAAKGSTEALQGQITDLQGQISTRDADLKQLNEALSAAQADAGKLTEAQSALQELQGKYEADKSAWETKVAQQAYEYAVKTEVGKLKFSSAAAQREFQREAIEKGFKLENDTLLGWNDYVDAYKKADPNVFAADETKPGFVLPQGKGGGTNDTKFNFHFNGVRQAPKE